MKKFMMKTVRRDRYDFVVCGGGLSGVAAAVSAARRGLSVALVEKNGFLGGVATAAGINQLLGGRKLNEKGQHVRVVGGIFDELTDALIASGNAIEPNTVDLSFNPFGWYPRMASGISCNEVALKIALDTLCDEAGVRVYFDTVAATTYNFDLPDPLKVSYDPMMGDVRNPQDVREHVVIRIPYGALLSEGVSNLIVAGSCPFPPKARLRLSCGG